MKKLLCVNCGHEKKAHDKHGCSAVGNVTRHYSCECKKFVQDDHWDVIFLDELAGWYTANKYRTDYPDPGEEIREQVYAILMGWA